MNTYQVQLERLTQMERMTVIMSKQSKKMLVNLMAELIEQLGFNGAAEEIRNNKKAKDNALFAVNMWAKGGKLYNLEGQEITPEGREDFYNKYSQMLIKMIEKIF
jgi:hypothetical protein